MRAIRASAVARRMSCGERSTHGRRDCRAVLRFCGLNAESLGTARAVHGGKRIPMGGPMRKLIVLAGLITPAIALAVPPPNPQVPIAGKAIPQFAQPLPLLSVQAAGAPNNVIDTRVVSGPLTLRMCEFRSHVLPPGTFAPGKQPETWTWGYIVGDACPAGVQETYL